MLILCGIYPLTVCALRLEPTVSGAPFSQQHILMNGPLSGNVRDLRELHDVVVEARDVLAKNSQHLDNVLETLDMHHHCLGVMAVLTVKFDSAGASVPDNRFIQAQEFILNCNVEQLRCAPDLCKYL